MAALVLNLLGGFEARLKSGVAGNADYQDGASDAGPPGADTRPTAFARQARGFAVGRPGRSASTDQSAANLGGAQEGHPASEKSMASHRRRLDRARSRRGRDRVVIFEDLAAQATAQTLAQAADLYKGDLLQGFDVRSECFSDWLRGEREQLHRRALQVLNELLVLQCDSTRRSRLALRAALRLLSHWSTRSSLRTCKARRVEVARARP